MHGKFLFFGALIVSTFGLANAQVKKKPIILDTKAIVNGKAKVLPKPVYTGLADALCVGGKVNVKVLIDMSGNVIKAKAISGDELLRETSVEAARKAKFPPSFIDTGDIFHTKGIIIYNFDSFVMKKCVEGGVLNSKAISLPTPSIPINHIRIKEVTEIRVRVLVDAFEGKVITTHSATGHPLLRGAFEAAARNATFTPLQHGGQVFVKGVLIYKVNPDWTVETDFGKKKIEGKAIFLTKPPVLQFGGKFGKNEKIIVEVTVNEKGEITDVIGLSGHLVFRAACEEAARKSKFSLSIVEGKPIETKFFVTYDFKMRKIQKIIATIKPAITKYLNIISYGVCVEKPLSLPKPEFPKSCRCAGDVQVQILVDEKGNGESAEALSGHPLLQVVSVKATLQSKFSPRLLSGNPVKWYGIIVYKFLPAGDVDNKKSF